MNKGTRLSWGSLLIVLSLILTACGGGATQPATGGEQPEGGEGKPLCACGRTPTMPLSPATRL